MFADPEQTMAEGVTLAHRVSEDVDAWVVSQLPACSWQDRQERSTSMDGDVQLTQYVVVQVPSDQGEVEAATGDYIIRGMVEVAEPGQVPTTADVLDAVEGAEHIRIMAVRDARGAVSGVDGVPVLRWASSLILTGR